MSDISQAQAAQQGNRTTDGKYTFGTHAEPAGIALTQDSAPHHAAALLRAAAGSAKDPRTAKRSNKGFTASAEIDAAEANQIIHEYDKFVRRWNRKNQRQDNPYEYSEQLPDDVTSFRVTAYISKDGRYEPELLAKDTKGREHFIVSLATAPPSLAADSEAWRLLKEKTSGDKRWEIMEEGRRSWDEERTSRSHALLKEMGWSMKPVTGEKGDWWDIQDQGGTAVLQARLNDFEEMVMRTPDQSAYGSDVNMQSIVAPGGDKLPLDSIRLVKESLRLAIRSPKNEA